MARRFSGWHMTAILVGGFGVVVAVNVFMATQAVGSFGGVVVENSYVASQEFNDWLDEAAKENALGWTATVGRDGNGKLAVTTRNTPAGTTATAQLRHPLGHEKPRSWTLVADGAGGFTSTERLPEGRWLVRVTLANGSDRLRIERPIG
ncbi:MAG: FixH family protein [Erythrobacter sp.]